MRPMIIPNFRRNVLPVLGSLLIAQLLSAEIALGSDEHEWHPHHVSVPFGAVFKSSEIATFSGLEYEYRINDHIGMGGFYEEVFGQIDLQAFGLLFNYHPDNSWKLSGGPAVERKLGSSENKFLVKLAVGYDFHAGNWSFGPTAAVDFVEDNHQVGYLGWTIGYGF
jgi:hypothetical protein